MVYAYIRVSTKHQDTATQRFELNRFAKRLDLHVDTWIEEKISGTKDLENRELNTIVQNMQSGDHVICTEVSRLGRSMQIIARIMSLFLNKCVYLHTMKENYMLSKDEAISKLILQIYGYAAETEHDLICERTMEGLENAKRKGKKLGRPYGAKSSSHKLDDRRDQIIIDLAKGKKKVSIAKKLKCNVSTLYVYIKEWDVYKDVEEYKAAGFPRHWHKYNNVED